MKKDFSAFAYIQEQSSFAEDYNGNFGYEVHDRGNRFFLTFNAVCGIEIVESTWRKM